MRDECPVVAASLMATGDEADARREKAKSEAWESCKVVPMELGVLGEVAATFELHAKSVCCGALTTVYCK